MRCRRQDILLLWRQAVIEMSWNLWLLEYKFKEYGFLFFKLCLRLLYWSVSTIHSNSMRAGNLIVMVTHINNQFWVYGIVLCQWWSNNIRYELCDSSLPMDPTEAKKSYPLTLMGHAKCFIAFFCIVLLLCSQF